MRRKNKIMKRLNRVPVLRTGILAFALLSLVVPAAHAQVSSLTPVVIGSTGSYTLNTPANLSLSATCGEVVIPTVSTTSTVNNVRILTQGFQQPRTATTLALTATTVFANVTCSGAGDGTATVTATGGGGGYTYQWSNGDSTATVDSLVPGTYSVTVTDAGGLTVNQTVTISEGTELCGVYVYSGLTPNGDGHNDFWFIEYIDLYMPNSVVVFDRWGTEVWSGENYDNINVVWTGKDKQGNDLPDGTYFYLIKVGDKTKKDWVELTH
ncbi:MAG: Ig family protein [Bacteroidetes bacterium]|nr:MAG: Ig family protein [Bacteroidota bacterium]